MKLHKYTALQYMVVTRSTDMVDKTLVCICRRWRNGADADHSLRPDTGISEQRDPSEGEQFEMEHLETVQGCVDVLAKYCAAPQLSERIL